MKKRILAILLAVCIVLSTVPVALATSTTECTGECNHAAAIGNTHYDTLAEAVAAAQDDDTVVLTQDVTLSNPLTINKSITLESAAKDGGGYNTLTYTGSDRAIEMPNNADSDYNVTIKNLTVDCTASYCERGINYNDNGTLTLNNVTVKGTNVTYALNLPGKSNGATVNISDGAYTGCIALNVWGANCTITATDAAFTTVDNTAEEGYGTVKLNNDGTTSAENSTITINGGSITVTGTNTNESTVSANNTSTGQIIISDTTVVDGEAETTNVAVVLYEGTDNFYSCSTLQEAIDLAVETNAASVKLIRDVTENVTITDAVTIDGNGKTLTYTGSYYTYPIDITTESGEVVTIKNLTISTTSGRGINCNTLGTLNLDNVDITAANYALNLRGATDNGIVNVSGSKLTGACTLNIWGSNMQITVTDTEIISNDNAASEDYAAVSLNSDGTADMSATDTVLNVTGGKIIAYKEDGTTPSKAVRSAVEATVTISDTTEVIGTRNYPVAIVTFAGSTDFYSEDTLQDAIDVAIETNAASVKLIKDITLTESVTVDGTVTLDLNGKTISGTILLAAEGATLTASEGLDVTTDYFDANSGVPYYVVYSDGTYVLKPMYTISIDLNGGNYVQGVSNYKMYVERTLAAIQLTQAAAKFTREGHTFKGWYDAAEGGNEITTTTEFNSDTTIYAQWTEEVVPTYEAFIDANADGVQDEGETGYATLAAAIDAAASGDTITLLDDVTVSEKIDVNKNVTVDLNGKTLTNAVVQNRLFNIKTGCSEFTLVGTTANSKIVHAPDMTYDTRNFGIIRVDAADVKVTVDGGTYACNTMTAVLFRTYASNTQFVFTNVVVETDGMILHTNSGSTVSSATITGGSYTSTGTSDKGNGFAISALTGPVNFKNVTISVAHGVAVEIGGTSAAVGNFENCTFTTTSDAYAAAPGAAIAVSGEAIANIISGTYTGSDNDGTYGKNAVMIYTSGGTVNVKGGTLNGDINVYDAGGYSDKAFAVEVTGTPTVNGGIEITDADASVNTIAVAVKGGAFSSDPTTYLASGYCVKHDTNYIVGTHGGTDDNDCTTAVLCGHCNAEITAAQASHTPNADDGDCTTAVTCSACGTVTTAAAAEHDWSDANGTCKTCGTTCGGSHSAGTTCSTCGKVTAPVYYPTYTPTVTPSAPSTSTEVTENEDGSTTTTVTDNKTGTVTETTENTDGSTTTVETQKDGTVTETVENTDGSTQVTETKAETTVKDDGTTETVTNSTTTATDADGNVTTSTTTATETTTVTDEGATVTEKVEQTKTESAEAVVETTTTATTTATEEKTETVAVTEETTTKADGTVETKTTTTTETELADGTTATAVTDESGKTEAEVVISEEAAASEDPVALPIPAVTASTDSEAASTVTVTTNSETDTAVVIPVAEGTGAGTVAVIVNADGTETVVTESVVTENGLEVAVPDGATIKVVDNSTDFVDVADNDWEKDAVDFTSARGIMQGTSTGENATFDSETPTTRAMVWTMLARLSGVDTTPAEGESWWTVGQKWAMENGISDGTMHDGEITREQLATMLYRYVGEPETDHDITHFDDHHETSDWALAAKEWAVANGVISGVGQADGSVTLEPKGNAIRSHVAQMFMNFMTKVDN